MSDDYLFIDGYKVGPYIRRKPSRSEETHAIDCAFCDGTGVHPGNVRNEDCPPCKGTGKRRIKGNREDYSECGRCGGSGKEQDSPSIDPCHVCDGSGLV